MSTDDAQLSRAPLRLQRQSCGIDECYTEALANGGSIEVNRPYLTRSCQKMSQF
jgi:hypothetical protein